jgi:hypothetical protein
MYENATMRTYHSRSIGRRAGGLRHQTPKTKSKAQAQRYIHQRLKEPRRKRMRRRQKKKCLHGRTHVRVELEVTHVGRDREIGVEEGSVVEDHRLTRMHTHTIVHVKLG